MILNISEGADFADEGQKRLTAKNATEGAKDAKISGLRRLRECFFRSNPEGREENKSRVQSQESQLPTE